MAAIDEALGIGREAGLAVEIFHLKVSGRLRWGLLPPVVAKIEAARKADLDVRATNTPTWPPPLPLPIASPVSSGRRSGWDARAAV